MPGPPFVVGDQRNSFGVQDPWMRWANFLFCLFALFLKRRLGLLQWEGIVWPNLPWTKIPNLFQLFLPHFRTPLYTFNEQHSTWTTNLRIVGRGIEVLLGALEDVGEPFLLRVPLDFKGKDMRMFLSKVIPSSTKISSNKGLKGYLWVSFSQTLERFTSQVITLQQPWAKSDILVSRLHKPENPFISNCQN